MRDNKLKEITQDLVNTIIRGETMVPICSIGPLLERIEELEQHLREMGYANISNYLFSSVDSSRYPCL